MRSDSKMAIIRRYRDLINVLNEIQAEISKLKPQTKDLRAINNKFIQTIDAAIKSAENELGISVNQTIWDRLVIAFFGETNAGKSTIIETFRILYDPNREMNSDGIIVGDGRHDFTKDYKEYELSINGRPFTLIDVPGIEGDEIEFTDKIKIALRKAHIVFYVQGHNKKPDEGTALKIKNYLNDWVKVYSIYNVRGGVSNYDE